MNKKLILLSLSLLGLLAACQTANPTINPRVNEEFTLERDQTATIRGTNLIITFSSVLSDDRCPIDVECAASGPVTISLSVQREGDIASPVTLQTFTDQEGRTPAGEFEGIENTVEVGEHVIRLIGVLPYPRNLSGIKASDYQATLIVTPK